MSDAWGGSWGSTSSWGAAWGSAQGVAPTVGGGGGDRRRKKKPRPRPYAQHDQDAEMTVATIQNEIIPISESTRQLADDEEDDMISLMLARTLH